MVCSRDANLFFNADIQSSHLWKRLLFCLLNGLDTLIKNQLTFNVRIFLNYQFYSIDLYVYSYANFDYCNFVVSFEIENCESTNLVLIFQYCFGSSGLMNFCMNYKIVHIYNKKLKFWEGLHCICKSIWGELPP